MEKRDLQSISILKNREPAFYAGSLVVIMTFHTIPRIIDGNYEWRLIIARGTIAKDISIHKSKFV